MIVWFLDISFHIDDNWGSIDINNLYLYYKTITKV